MRVVERFLQAKSGDNSKCEDRIVVGEYFVAVLDGATAKSAALLDGRTPGQLAVEIVGDCILNLPKGVNHKTAVLQLTACLSSHYRRRGLLKRLRTCPHERPAASIAMYSRLRREVWIVGECKALIGDIAVAHESGVDRVWSAARAIVLETAIARGRTVRSLRERDPGREFVRPGLVLQCLLQNAGPGFRYSYSEIDGFPVRNSGIRVLKIPTHVDELVLGSDGYPVLRSTLRKTEAALKRIIRLDPLCFRVYPSTKGVGLTDQSFDDRSYLRFSI